MSLRAMAWVWDQEVAGADKLLLLALADCANDEGVCWPGQARLAAKCCVTDRSVRSTLGRLEAAGLIVREERRRSDGTRTSDLISLGYRSTGSPPPGAAQQPEAERPINRKPTSGVNARVVDGVNEPSEEPSGFSTAGARADQVPDGFPVTLLPHLNSVEAVLTDLAAGMGAVAVSRRSLARVLMARQRKPLVLAAHDFAAWADGLPRPRRDVVGGYRNWLDKAPDLAAVERLDEDGRPTAAAQLPRNGRSSGRRPNASELLRAINGMEGGG